MKRTLILLSIAGVLMIGGVGALLMKQVSAAKERERAALAAAQAETTARVAQEERVHEAERNRASVEKQNAELTDLATRLRQSEAKQASNITALAKPSTASTGDAEPTSGKGMSDMLQKMMKDPAMKEMLRNQQKGMMKTMYGPLFKDLNLPAEQQAKLTELLLDAQMSTMDNAADLLSGDATTKTNALGALSEKQKAITEQIKAVLGEENYAQYEDYQKSMGDRMVLNQFQQQAAGTETALSDEQYKRLVQLMKEERTKAPPVIGGDPATAAEGFSKLMNEDLLNQQFQWQEDFNKRVFDRAGELLTPEQLKELSDFQTQQMNLQKLSMKMAREMFKEGK